MVALERCVVAVAGSNRTPYFTRWRLYCTIIFFIGFPDEARVYRENADRTQGSLNARCGTSCRKSSL